MSRLREPDIAALKEGDFVGVTSGSYDPPAIRRVLRRTRTQLVVGTEWMVAEVKRPDAGGTLYNAVRVTDLVEHLQTPTHDRAVAQREVDRLNAIRHRFNRRGREIGGYRTRCLVSEQSALEQQKEHAARRSRERTIRELQDTRWQDYSDDLLLEIKALVARSPKEGS